MLGEPQNQFSLTGAALSTFGAQSSYLSVSVIAQKVIRA
jgi:hypothetical protein